MIEFSHDGQTTYCRDGRDMLKAMGVVPKTGRPIIMTDETGMVVGAGIDGDSLLKSMPIIEEIRKTPLPKPRFYAKQPERPLQKSMAPAPAGFSPSAKALWDRLEKACPSGA